MSSLTELEAACNQLTHLPARLSELTNLRSLCLRSNQLMYLPRELTSLSLVTLDISSNKIASLPVELRLMTSLVDLNLADNPLTSPPAQLCVRGIVHIVKFLETVAAKQDGKAEGTNSLRRTLPKQNSTPVFNEILKGSKKNSVDGYSTSDYGLDSKWDQEPHAKWQFPTTPLHVRTELSKSDTSTPAGISPGGFYGGFDEDSLKRQLEKRTMNHSNPTLMTTNGASDEFAETPSPKSDEKPKPAGNIQTYREYKEALRQQRSHDSSSVYKSRDGSTPEGSSELILKLQGSSGSSPLNGSNQTSPMYTPYRSISLHAGNGHNGKEDETDSKTAQKPPIAKSVTNGTHQNGNHLTSSEGYTKPNSPGKTQPGILQHNNLKNSIGNNSLQGKRDHSATGNAFGFISNKSGQKTNK